MFRSYLYSSSAWNDPCPVEFNFLPTISLGWAPSGVLGYDFLPWEKMFRHDTTYSVRLHHSSSYVQSLTINHSVPKALIKSRAVNQMWPHHQNHSTRRRFSLIHLFSRIMKVFEYVCGFLQFFLMQFFATYRNNLLNCEKLQKLHQKKYTTYTSRLICEIKLLECILRMERLELRLTKKHSLAIIHHPHSSLLDMLAYILWWLSYQSFSSNIIWYWQYPLLY